MKPNKAERQRIAGRKHYAAHRERVLAGQAERRAANQEAIRAKAAVYRAATREEARVYQRAYYAKNRERVREEQRKFYLEHADRINAERRAFRARHPEKVREWNARFHRKHPGYYSFGVARRQTRKRKAPGRGITKEQWLEILRGALGLCAYCGERKRLSLDHIVPLSDGGEHDVENAAAACKSCNSSKHNASLLLWMARRRLEGRRA